MANLMQLRLAGREIFEEAIRAVDADKAVRTAIRLQGSRLTVGNSSFQLSETEQIYSVGVGKAARAMARALEEMLGRRFVAGIVSAQAPSLTAKQLSDRWRCFEGGHPTPNDESLAAAQAVFGLLERANHERALVIFLISGGGSAMLEWPVSAEITLDDLVSANRVLVNSGASITEINAVRRAFSAVKSGRLAERTPNCRRVTLIVSDVPRGKEGNVASGPTLPPPTDAPTAAEVVARYGIKGLPATVLRAIERPERPLELPDNPYFVLLENETAMEAAANAARRCGFSPEIAHKISDGPIELGVVNLLGRLIEQTNQSDGNAGLISGGEFSCPVRGDGIGGRNLETALRLAIAADEQRSEIAEFVALCAGTDGIDGNSPAAGAIVDSTTIARARRIGLDPHDFLSRSAAYSFFVALGDAITTGPTGTNVRDLRILLASASVSTGSGSDGIKQPT